MRAYLAGSLLAIFLLLPGGCSGEDSWSGKCVGVLDGDTIEVLRAGKPARIRLFGIDCPERHQAFGTRARQLTSRMVFGKTVLIEPVDRDHYDRIVAWVSVDGISLNRELLRAGLAWWYRTYARRHRDLEQLERDAKAAKLGLWADLHPVPPWRFRHDHKPHP
jgi:micrococcal nuclease